LVDSSPAHGNKEVTMPVEQHSYARDPRIAGRGAESRGLRDAAIRGFNGPADGAAHGDTSDMPDKTPDLCALPGVGRVILVSNRGPVERHFGPAGAPAARRGAGGVVSGLIAALGGRPATWISLAMTEADRAVAASGRPMAAPDDMRDAGD